jgi:thiol-disulfide isomerase/thioredoxin
MNQMSVQRLMLRMSVLFLLLLAPPVEAQIYDIKALDLTRYEGKVVYLDFWASWCKPCQKSFPWMNSLLEKYPAGSFALITINLDQDASAMNYFLGKVQANFDIYHDPAGKIAEKFDLQGMPTSYLIDSSGKVVQTHVGFYEKETDRYEREIEALL